MVTSPPSFNAPLDYQGLFKNYAQYLGLLKRVLREVGCEMTCFRVEGDRATCGLFFASEFYNIFYN